MKFFTLLFSFFLLIVFSVVFLDQTKTSHSNFFSKDTSKDETSSDEDGDESGEIFTITV